MSWIAVVLMLVGGHPCWGLSLTEKLQKKAADSAAKAPAAKRKIMLSALEELKSSEILKTAKKKGDRAPDFQLPDFQKGLVSSKTLLQKGPLVVVFYRGGWCPYCNIQLHDLQENLVAIEKAGAQLVAISPELPDRSQETVKKQKLNFYVLSDAHGRVGEAFGLMYQIPETLNTLYKSFGIDLEKSNGNKERRLPLAATYIIESDGKIAYSFLDVDYKKRAETKDIIRELEKLQRERKNKAAKS